MKGFFAAILFSLLSKPITAEDVGGVVIGLMLFIAALLIGSFIFWLIMLIDCIKREFDQKALWIILILVLGIVGAILYYFMVKRKGP